MEDFPLIPVLLGASVVALAALIGFLVWKLRGRQAPEVPDHVKQVQALVEAKRLDEAAALEVSAGNLSAAINLYIQTGNHSAASKLAERQQDLERAAALAETAGEVDRAAGLYGTVRDHRAVGRLFKAAGRFREAAEALAQDREVDAGELAETWERAALASLGEETSLTEMESADLDALELAVEKAEGLYRRRGDRKRAEVLRGVLDRHDLDPDTAVALIAQGAALSERLGRLAKAALEAATEERGSAPVLMSQSDFANAIKRSVGDAAPEEPMPEWAEGGTSLDGGFEEVPLTALSAAEPVAAASQAPEVDSGAFFDIWSSAGADDLAAEFEEAWGATAGEVSHFDAAVDTVAPVTASLESPHEDEDAPLPALRGEVALLPASVAPLPPSYAGFDDLDLDLDELPAPVTMAEAVVSEALAAADVRPAPGAKPLPAGLASSLREYLAGSSAPRSPGLAKVLDKTSLTQSERAMLSRAVRQASTSKGSDVEAMLLDYLKD